MAFATPLRAQMYDPSILSACRCMASGARTDGLHLQLARPMRSCAFGRPAACLINQYVCDSTIQTSRLWNRQEPLGLHDLDRLTHRLRRDMHNASEALLQFEEHC